MTATCVRCGFEWEPKAWRRDRPQTCPECPTMRVPRSGFASRGPGHGVYDMALELTNLRLAVEMATALAEMGRHGEALEVLYAVEAPMRRSA